MADLTQIPKPTVVGVLYNAVRGGLIGIAELIPGVSGGTIALITGVYESVLDSGNHLVSAVKALIVGPERLRTCKQQLCCVNWWLLVPMMLGMAAMVLSLAGVMSSFVSTTPSLARGLFLGMVATSVVVPLAMVDWRRFDWRRFWIDGLLLIASAVVAFLLTGQGGSATIHNPQWWIVFAAAAVAICALALPGVSGSFFLLVVGLYEPTMAAIHARDLGYIAVFGLGALTGIAFFIRILHWMMNRHHTATMFVMAGLLLGSLRALWPWQSVEGVFLAPGGDASVVLLLALGGAAIVAALVIADKVITMRQEVERKGVDSTNL